jgi:hypothetical protein
MFKWSRNTLNRWRIFLFNRRGAALLVHGRNNLKVTLLVKTIAGKVTFFIIAATSKRSGLSEPATRL